MTSEQIAQAQRLARESKPKNAAGAEKWAAVRNGRGIGEGANGEGEAGKGEVFMAPLRNQKRTTEIMLKIFGASRAQAPATAAGVTIGCWGSLI